jgi:hypothetical protein
MKHHHPNSSAVSAWLKSGWILASLWVLLSPCQGSPTAAQPSPTPPATREEVIRLYGEPAGSVVVGVKEILTYPERKVLITAGKVTSIAPNASARGESASKNLRYLRPPRGSFRLGYDPDVWVRVKSPDTEFDRFVRSLTHFSGRIELNLNTENASFAGHDLAAIVLERMRATDTAATIKKKEQRRIKGGEFTYFRIQVRIRGILNEVDFYIHSSPKGTAQLMISGLPEDMSAFATDVISVVNGLEILSVNTPEIPEVEPVKFKESGFELSFVYDPRDWTRLSDETKPPRTIFKFVRGDLSMITEKFPPGLSMDDVIKLLKKRFGDPGKITPVMNSHTITIPGGQLHCGRLYTVSGFDQADRKTCHFYLYDNPNGVDAVIFTGLVESIGPYAIHSKQIVYSLATTSPGGLRP